jgi:hypothetical protein
MMRRIESEGLKILVPALPHSLTHLDLSANNIGPDGVAALTIQLPNLSKLVHLDLSKNRLMHALGGLPERQQSACTSRPPHIYARKTFCCAETVM